MSKQGDAALAGGVTSAAIVLGRSYFRISNKVRDARDDARDAIDTADESLRVAQSLATSGDIRRIGSDAVSDFLAGLGFPAQSASTEPSAFASAPSIIPRPTITEALAITPTSWPPAVNDYDDRGNLKKPEDAFSGQNFLTGLVLSYPEVRASLAGLTHLSGGVVNPAVETQHYRFFHAIALELLALANAGGISQAQYQLAVRQMLGGVVPGGVGLAVQLLDRFAADSATVTNTTTETQVGILKIPAGTLKKVGDVLRVNTAVTSVAVNSTNTHQVRIRLDSLSGTLLWDTGAVNPAAGASGVIEGRGMVQTVGSGGVLALGGSSALGGSAQGPATGSVSLDLTVDHYLVISVLQSVASAGNSQKARFGEATYQAA